MYNYKNIFFRYNALIEYLFQNNTLIQYLFQYNTLIRCLFQYNTLIKFLLQYNTLIKFLQLRTEHKKIKHFISLVGVVLIGVLCCILLYAIIQTDKSPLNISHRQFT